MPSEPEIFSDAWWEIWKFVAGECGKRGMGIGLSGYTLDWPNGQSLISRTIYGDPEIQGREIAIARKQRVAAGKALACELPADTVAVRAYPVGATGFGPGSLDLTSRVQRPASGVDSGPRRLGSLGLHRRAQARHAEPDSSAGRAAQSSRNSSSRFRTTPRANPPRG